MERDVRVAAVFVCLLFTVLMLTWTLSGSSSAANFDCAKAATSSEKLICSDGSLSAADDRLAKAYRMAMKTSRNKQALKHEQQNWIQKERDVCQDAACMLKAYESRIAALEGGHHDTAQTTQKAEKANESPQDALKQANENFTYLGQLINPFALAELFPWLSDTLPGPVAVDLAGTTASTNRYLATVTSQEGGWIWAAKTEHGAEQKFGYKRLGVLTNGAQVLLTEASGGGSGVFTNLLLVKFQSDVEYGDEGKRRDRLIIMRVGAISLGDRYSGPIKVEQNQITIGPGKNIEQAQTPERVIKFD